MSRHKVNFINDCNAILFLPGVIYWLNKKGFQVQSKQSEGRNEAKWLKLKHTLLRLNGISLNYPVFSWLRTKKCIAVLQHLCEVGRHIRYQ